MLLRCLKAEVLKCRRAPVWLAFLVLPVFPAVLGTGNYLGNLGLLQNEWYSLWSQHTLFSSMFFLPALLGVFCAWQWRLEHTDHNWNSFMTAPVSVGTLYGAKLVLAAGMSLLAQGWIGVLFLLSGKLVGLTAPIPPELPEWLLCGAVGGVAVCGVQLLLSLVIRAFAPPVALGLLGGIAGLVVTAQGWGYAFPYSLLCIGMRANNPAMELDLAPFLLSAAAWTAACALLSVAITQRREGAAEGSAGGENSRRTPLEWCPAGISHYGSADSGETVSRSRNCRRLRRRLSARNTA